MGRIYDERLMGTRIAKRFDGTGVVRLQCSEGAFNRMKLANLPHPPEWGENIGGTWFVPLETRAMGADSVRYRIVWPDPVIAPRGKLRMSSFSLSGAHVMETLYVLAEFLRDQGVNFVGIANKHGTRFKDVRLGGSNLAYLTRDIPHSPACHVDFGLHQLPEVSGSTGRVVNNSPLNR